MNIRTILRDMAFLKKELNAPLIFDPSVRGYRYEQTKVTDMSEEKTSKWTRLLTLIHRIYAEPGRTAKELAEITGRTERTIFRDVSHKTLSGEIRIARQVLLRIDDLLHVVTVTTNKTNSPRIV